MGHVLLEKRRFAFSSHLRGAEAQDGHTSFNHSFLDGALLTSRRFCSMMEWIEERDR